MGCSHQTSAAPPERLFGATLRPDGHGRIFAPLAFEWAEGPAADPLQLALQLSMEQEVKLQVEMISGGWSETWMQKWKNLKKNRLNN